MGLKLIGKGGSECFHNENKTEKAFIPKMPEKVLNKKWGSNP